VKTPPVTGENIISLGHGRKWNIIPTIACKNCENVTIGKQTDDQAC